MAAEPHTASRRGYPCPRAGAALAVSPPPFTRADRPDLLAQWSDRVALAESKRARGTLTKDDLDEIERARGMGPAADAAATIGEAIARERVANAALIALAAMLAE